MELLRILKVLLVFMMIWMETSNQEIRSEKELNERIKRYHESDLVRYKMITEQVRREREKKNILTELMNPQISLKTQSTPFYNSGTSNTVVTPQQLMNMNQAHNTNLNNRKPFVLHTPKYDSDTKNVYNENCEKNATKTENLEKEKGLKIDKIEDVKEKEEILDTVNIEKANEIIDKDLPLKEPRNVELQEPKVVKDKTKSKKKVHHHHHHPHKNKNYHGDKNDESKAKNSDLPLLNTKLDNTPTEPTIHPDKIKCNNENTSEENVHIENAILDEVININKEQRKQDETQSKKHPFLDAIQNDHYITTSKLKEEDKVTETNIDETAKIIKNDIKILEQSTSDSNLPNEVDLIQGKSEEIIIKNKIFDEVIKVTKPIYEVNTQNNKVPMFNENYRQASNYNQIPKTECYCNHNAPDKQRTFQNEDGSTVVTYNNYFKLPTSYANANNNNKLYYNNNRCYEYRPSRGQNGDVWYNNGYYPSQRQVKDGNWRNGKGYYQNNSNDKDIIWRSWNNTEYYLKSQP